MLRHCEITFVTNCQSHNEYQKFASLFRHKMTLGNRDFNCEVNVTDVLVICTLPQTGTHSFVSDMIAARVLHHVTTM